MARAFWDRLVEPWVVLDSTEHRKARLLAGLLFSLVMLGALSAVIQAVTVPNFRPTLLAMTGALGLLTLAYAGSRTRLYRLSAGLAAAAPALACIAVGVRTPDDRVWYGFILIAVVVASLFFSVRAAAVVAAVIFTALCLLPIWVLELRAPERLIPLLALHGVLSPLLLIAAHHHAAFERDAQHERLRREAHLAEIERLEAFARSAAHVAHDLNNVITVIDANVAHLGRLLAGDHGEVVGETRAAVDRLAKLGRNLTLTARDRLEPAKDLAPEEVVRGVAPILSELAGPSAELVIDGSSSERRIAIDPLRLEQVLMNLVANARDAMPDGGRIVIGCRLVVSHSAEGEPIEYVAIDVSDTGVGMSTEVLARIFQPFFTTKTNGRGTGLGLAIVQEIVMHYGGEVRVTSAPGRGSRFSVLLPAR